MKSKQEELAKKRQEEQARISHPPVPEEEKAVSGPTPSMKKLERILLWLGWASLLAIPYMLIFAVSPVSKLFYFLLVMESVTFLVQLHLRRHGLSRIFRNEKVSKVFRTVCTWIWLILGFLMVIFIAAFISAFFEALFADRLSRFKWWNIFSMIIPSIYYFLWASFHSQKG